MTTCPRNHKAPWPAAFALFTFWLWPLVSDACFAEDAPSGLALLQAASHDTTLNDDSESPFYLKIDVQLYDVKGRPAEQATAEEWWARNGIEKRVYTSGSGRYSEVREPGEILRSQGAPYPPELLELMVNQVVHPLSLDHRTAEAPVMRALTVGTVPLTCAILVRKSFSSNLPTDYCFQPGTTSLRLTLEYGTRIIIRNSVGKFGDKYVPLVIAVKDGDRMLATGRITALNRRAVTPDEVSADGLTQRFAIPNDSSSGTASKALTQPSPIYPQGAKSAHREGVVALRATVGTDGHVRDVEVIFSHSSDLGEAAVDAVRRWVYTPYTVNGKPQQVETTIIVDFSFGHS